MATSDESTVEPPRAWVEDFLDSEVEIRGVLNDVREAHVLGESETVREKLRAFAQTENGIFRVVALAVLDVETFYTDLKDQYEDESPPIETLQAIGSDFDRLADDLELVLSERMNEFRNPRPGLRRGFRYSEETQLPRLDYDVYSGDVKLCQFIHPPSQALVLVQSILHSTRKLLEQVEANSDPIAETERERIANMHNHLSEELTEMAAYIEATDGEETGGELEPFDDWSFY
ncbi:hypothetical protein NDI56_14120 [Haloarcula sp. S1CR25-12]|uniref:Uncharacterized protein n=1 Tax=Haloarcula saliterrae TaxID=2950534 RepID=A0ABU2FF17_9EURY|nr:hypothetical protein [Haloarcula sp. S1CR25-12]MDS0260538.1 hypothetical protein [Haloarcula sp. S1CR25-12]